MATLTGKTISAWLDRLEHRVRSRDKTSAEHRIGWAARLYGSSHPAVARITRAPKDPDRIAEFRLDQILERPELWSKDGCPGVTLVRIELDLDPHREANSAPRPWRIPPSNPKFPRIWIPPLRERSAPLELPGGIRPRTWPEAHWLAGQVDGLYLARRGAVRRAIRSTGGLVEARGYAGTWKAVGRVEVITKETAHGR